MVSHIRSGFCAGLALFALACAGDDSGGQDSGLGYDAGVTPVSTTPVDSGASSNPVDAGGTSVKPAVDSGVSTTTDSAVASVDSGSTTPIDAGGTNADASSADAGSAEAGSTGATSLTGTYGSLGPVKPVVSSLWINTGLETILYLSSAPLTCAEVMTPGGRWLLMVPSDAQVLEIVMRGKAKVGTLAIPGAEANYAQGSKSSATEKGASSGSLMITKAEATGVIEGSVMATYSGGGSVMGTFHAEYCSGGQEW
jgi:hypothetical protein